MSELTVAAIRLGLLILLWIFVFSIVSVLRGDLYGTRSAVRSGEARPSRSTEPKRPPRAIRKGPSHLAVVDGTMRGITVPLSETGVLIGRNPECSLVLSDDFASGRHARVYRDGDGWFIDDLGSTNGTFVGDQRVDQHFPLPEGTLVRIGRTVLEVRK